MIQLADTDGKTVYIRNGAIQACSALCKQDGNGDEQVFREVTLTSGAMVFVADTPDNMQAILGDLDHNYDAGR